MSTNEGTPGGHKGNNTDKESSGGLANGDDLTGTVGQAAPASHKTETKAASASIWLGAARAVSQATNLILLLVAARLLSPAEIGSFTLVSSLAMILLQCAETGWYQRVSMASKDEPLPSQIFWLGMAAGAFWLCVSLMAALGIWFVYESATYAIAMAWLSLLVPLTSFISIQTGVMMLFGVSYRLGRIQIAAEIIGLAAGLAALWYGAGIFGLVVFKLVSQAIIAVGVGFTARWFPKLPASMKGTRHLLVFVGQLLSERLVSFFSIYGAEFLIGFFLGTAAVGLYRAGMRIVGALTELIFEPARLIYWTILPNAKSTGHESGQSPILDVTAGLSAIALPAFLGLTIVSADLIAVLLGPQWQLAAVVMSIAAITRLAHLVVPLAISVMTMSGGARYIAPFTMLLTGTSFASLLLYGRFGVIEAAVSQLAAALLTGPIALVVLARYSGVPVRLFLKSVAPYTLAAIAMLLSILALRNTVNLEVLPLSVRLLIEIATGAVLYVGALLVIRPPLFVRLWKRWLA